MSTTANMSLIELRVLQERWKKEDKELQWRMEEAKEQEARAEEERGVAEAEEVWKAKVGKKWKTVGSVEEDGLEALEGFAKGEPCYLC